MPRVAVKAPFVAVNCAAIPDTLIESELFGYEEGAFTGARKGGKQGLFQTADNGTIFLDEIGDIPLSLQSRLLRVLEEREVMPVGSTSVIPIDVRVICATNRNLNEMVRQGTFREDLYYRLKILPLVIPPLRERVEDIPELLHSMAEGARLPAQLEHRLLHYTWPGNVRELRAFSSNLTIFYQQDIAPDQQQSLLNDLIHNFFGHRISAFTDCSEPLSQEDRLLLNSIQELTARRAPCRPRFPASPFAFVGGGFYRGQAEIKNSPTGGVRLHISRENPAGTPPYPIGHRSTRTG